MGKVYGKLLTKKVQKLHMDFGLGDLIFISIKFTNINGQLSTNITVLFVWERCRNVIV
jgi:hypothetical protein